MSAPLVAEAGELMPLSKDIDVAYTLVQERVADSTLVIEVGETVNVQRGFGGKVTTTDTALLVFEPLLTVNEYVPGVNEIGRLKLRTLPSRITFCAGILIELRYTEFKASFSLKFVPAICTCVPAAIEAPDATDVTVGAASTGVTGGGTTTTGVLFMVRVVAALVASPLLTFTLYVPTAVAVGTSKLIEPASEAAIDTESLPR